MNAEEGLRVRKSFILKLLACATFIILAVIAVPHVSAEDAELPDVHMRISPVSTSVKNLDPGQQYDGTVKVTNIGGKPFDFKVYASPYGVQDLTYENSFEARGDFNQIVHWISFDQEEYLGLEPKATIEVPYHINIPADPPGGAQYAVIFYETINQDESAGVIQTINRLGHTIFAEVNGDTKKEGEVVSLNQRGLIFEPPLGSTFVIKNTGNVDFTAIHKLTVESVFGEKLYEDTKDYLMIAESSREAEHSWGEAPIIGLFKVTNEVRLLDEVRYDQTKLVLMAPIWLIIIVIAAIIVLVVLIIQKILKSRGSNMKLTASPLR